MNHREKKIIIAVLGPTATGKSDIAFQLAKMFDAEIVNCDSRQIYSEMHIGTACPTKDTLQQVKHHLYNIIKPSVSFSVSDYATKAKDVITNIFSRGKFPILTGGSGFYFSSLHEGIGSAGHDKVLATKIKSEYEKQGLAYMLQYLKELDPDALNVIDTKNPRRVLRAIEIVKLTGRPFCMNRPVSLLPEATFYPVVVTRPRQELRNIIRQRVEVMIQMGLEDEVKSLFEKYGMFAPGLQAIGYQEWPEYFEGKIDKQQLIQKIVDHTCQYAKRQETWFKKRPGTNIYNISDKYDCENFFSALQSFICISG